MNLVEIETHYKSIKELTVGAPFPDSMQAFLEAMELLREAISELYFLHSNDYDDAMSKSSALRTAYQHGIKGE